MFLFVQTNQGCPEKIDVQFFPRPDWNAFADSQFGYGILEIVNRTTVVYQQKAIIYDCTCDYVRVWL